MIWAVVFLIQWEAASSESGHVKEEEDTNLFLSHVLSLRDPQFIQEKKPSMDTAIYIP